MPPKGHAVLSASSSERWLNCPPSARLCETYEDILASYAQEESRSASENQKWRIKKNFEEGMPWCGRMLGYRIRDGQYYIIPDEAEIVRHIYREYLDGAGPNSIANRLTEDGIPTRNGGIWQPQTIAKILRNYTYTETCFCRRPSVKITSPRKPFRILDKKRSICWRMPMKPSFH